MFKVGPGPGVQPHSTEVNVLVGKVMSERSEGSTVVTMVPKMSSLPFTPQGLQKKMEAVETQKQNKG